MPLISQTAKDVAQRIYDNAKNGDKAAFPYDPRLNANLCHYKSSQYIVREQPPNYNIVILGAGRTAAHSIITDERWNLLYDSLNGTFDPFTKIYTPSRLKNMQMPVMYTLTVRNHNMVRASIQTAKLDRTITDAFLKVCYIFVIHAIGDPIDAKLKKVLTDNKTLAEKFVTRFAIDRTSFRKLFNAAAMNKKFTQAEEDALQALGMSMKGAYPQFVVETDIEQVRLKLLKAFYIWFVKGNDSNFYKLERNIGILNDPTLSSYFTDEEVLETGRNAQSDNNKKLKALIKKHLGINETRLTVEQGKQLKAKDPLAYKQYNALRRGISEVYKDFIKTMVRKSGQKYLPYDQVISALNKAKIEHTLPTGFKGFIDDELNWYTEGGIQMKNKPAGVLSVTMNPKYDPNKDNAYVFIAGNQRYYSVDYDKTKKAVRFEKVDDLEKKLPALKKKWQNDILTKDGKLEQLLACGVEMVYRFAARTGNKGNATGGVPTYGATTILVKHVKVEGANLRIDYSGKKLSSQVHLLKPTDRVAKKMIEIIKKQISGKKPDDPVWTYNDGEQIPTISFTRYFKRLGSGGATLHKLRHVEGTMLARKILAKAPFRKGQATQSEVERWYKEAMKKVGELLVHVNGEKTTGLTAIKSYINPKVQQEFFLNLGLRVPSFLKLKKGE